MGKPVRAARWRLRCSPDSVLGGLEWRDAAGDLVADLSPAVSLRAILTSREDATALGPSASSADILATTAIPLDQPLDSRAPYRRVVYRITRDGNPFAPPPTPLIRLRSSTDSISVVECDRILPPDPESTPGTAGAEEQARALRPSLLIQSNDPAIRAAADSAVGRETDPWRRAVLLERFTANRIRRKDTRVLFGSAARTLATGEGDCTEHALLLAALARAQGIPARVVAGLVALGSAMEYHLWTEVAIRSRWIGIDAALDRAPVDGRYLPLAVTDLTDDSITPLSVGVLETLGRVRVEVLHEETEP